MVVDDSGSGKTILVVDDEEHVVKLLSMNLTSRGYGCLYAYTGEEGLEQARLHYPDLIILDVMLPGIDGIEVCRLLKSDPRTQLIPVLMLSAKSEGIDKIHGLEGGADDYITKPFSLTELFLRVEASLRQIALLTGARSGRPHMLFIGSLSIDTERYFASNGGEKIDLTPAEFKILNMLVKHQGEAVSRPLMYRELFDKDPADAGRSVDVHLRNIRKKLNDAGVTGCRIETVHGSGYRILPQP